MRERVVLIYRNPEYHGNIPLPPVGSCGDLMDTPDKYNEVEVMFDNYPCPALHPDFGPTWTCHVNMVVPLIDPDLESNETEKELLTEW